MTRGDQIFGRKKTHTHIYTVTLFITTTCAKWNSKIGNALCLFVRIPPELNAPSQHQQLPHQLPKSALFSDLAFSFYDDHIHRRKQLSKNIKKKKKVPFWVIKDKKIKKKSWLPLPLTACSASAVTPSAGTRRTSPTPTGPTRSPSADLG